MALKHAILSGVDFLNYQLPSSSLVVDHPASNNYHRLSIDGLKVTCQNHPADKLKFLQLGRNSYLPWCIDFAEQWKQSVAQPMFDSENSFKLQIKNTFDGQLLPLTGLQTKIHKAVRFSLNHSSAVKEGLVTPFRPTIGVTPILLVNPEAINHLPANALPQHPSLRALYTEINSRVIASGHPEQWLLNLSSPYSIPPVFTFEQTMALLSHPHEVALTFAESDFLSATLASTLPPNPYSLSAKELRLAILQGFCNGTDEECRAFFLSHLPPPNFNFHRLGTNINSQEGQKASVCLILDQSPPYAHLISKDLPAPELQALNNLLRLHFAAPNLDFPLAHHLSSLSLELLQQFDELTLHVARNAAYRYLKLQGLQETEFITPTVSQRTFMAWMTKIYRSPRSWSNPALVEPYLTYNIVSRHIPSLLTHHIPPQLAFNLQARGTPPSFQTALLYIYLGKNLSTPPLRSLAHYAYRFSYLLKKNPPSRLNPSRLQALINTFEQRQESSRKTIYQYWLTDEQRQHSFFADLHHSPPTLSPSPPSLS